MPHTETHFLQEELPEVPVEVAAFVRRRNLGTVEVPLALTGAVEAAAAGSSSRSSKLQRKETVQLTAALKQLSRTPGKGGSAMSLIDANAGSSEKRRRKRVTLVAVLDALVIFYPSTLPLLIMILHFCRLHLSSRLCVICAMLYQSA